MSRSPCGTEEFCNYRHFTQTPHTQGAQEAKMEVMLTDLQLVWFSGTFSVLALIILHPRKALRPRQTEVLAILHGSLLRWYTHGERYCLRIRKTQVTYFSIDPAPASPPATSQWHLSPGCSKSYVVFGTGLFPVLENASFSHTHTCTFTREKKGRYCSNL
jgi:hypothetical protein